MVINIEKITDKRFKNYFASMYITDIDGSLVGAINRLPLARFYPLYIVNVIEEQFLSHYILGGLKISKELWEEQQDVLAQLKELVETLWKWEVRIEEP